MLKGYIKDFKPLHLVLMCIGFFVALAIIILVVKTINFADFIQKTENKTFDSRQVMLVNNHAKKANKDIVIMNTKNTILGPLGKTFGEFIMLEFLNATFRRKHYAKEMGFNGQVPAHFLYIDEFATYSPVLTEMFTQGRSFRVGTHIAVQNRALLQMCGDELTEAQSLLIESNARNLVLFPGLNGEDARYYSAQFYNLRPEEICYRPFGQICYRVVANKSISRPGVGLVFFIDQKPNTNSIKLEEQYKSNGKNYKKIM